jgi:hypothetical protein
MTVVRCSEVGVTPLNIGSEVIIWKLIFEKCVFFLNVGYLYIELATIWWLCELFRYEEGNSRITVTRMATSTSAVMQGIFKRHSLESFGALNELCTSQPLGPI